MGTRTARLWHPDQAAPAPADLDANHATYEVATHAWMLVAATVCFRFPALVSALLARGREWTMTARTCHDGIARVVQSAVQILAQARLSWAVMQA